MPTSRESNPMKFSKRVFKLLIATSIEVDAITMVLLVMEQD